MKRIIFNFLIISYLFVIVFTGVPSTNTLESRLKERASRIAFAVGIWPSWGMFAPNPLKYDSKTFVEIKYENGMIREYDVEKHLTGPFAFIRKSRWMKYSQDNLRNPEQRVLIKPALRFFGNKYKIRGNPIVNMKLKRRWQEVHPFSHDRLFSINETPRIHKNEVLFSQRWPR